jgi:hypothetical protein
MHSRRIRQLLALVIGVLVLAGIGVGAAAAKSSDKKFTVFEPDAAGHSQWLNLAGPHKGDPGTAIGDLLLDHHDLVDMSSGTKLGEAVTRVQVLDVVGGDSVFNLDCTVKLAGGDIVFSGAGLLSKLGSGVTFAVIGGTRKYSGAKGVVTAKMTEHNGKPGSTIAFSLK